MRKRTLVIDSREGGDFSLDLIWAGLVRRLGPENVIDYPFREKHHRGLPVLIGDHEKDYGSERSSLGYTSRNLDCAALDKDMIMDEIRRGGIGRIFLDERQESIELYHSLRASFFPIPVVVVAGHDRFWNESPQRVMDQLPRLQAMFIDDWQPEYDGKDKIHLINLSINYDHLWTGHAGMGLSTEKVYDVCFMGYNSSGDRATFLDHISKKYSGRNNCIVLEKRPNEFGRFVRHQAYFENMARSKICINVKGGSACGRALRYYEIPYVGSCMLSQTFPARLLHPFKAGEHCFYFDSLDELDANIEYLLSDDEVREFIARKGHEHAMKFHTIDARMSQVFEVLNGQV